MDEQSGLHQSAEFLRQARDADVTQGDIYHSSSRTVWYLPTVAFSYGFGFHTEDPRIGNGTDVPTLLAPSRAEQLVLSKVLKQTQFYLTLRRTSNSQELAKIDPDTGLQEIVGPSVNKVISISAQRNFPFGAIYVSYAQADARDSSDGQPIPEAPRFIWDTVRSITRLPLRLQFRGEYRVRAGQTSGRRIYWGAGQRISRRPIAAVPGEPDVAGRQFPDGQRLHRTDDGSYFLPTGYGAYRANRWRTAEIVYKR